MLIPKQADIERYFKEKGDKFLYDWTGWSGEFHLSSKDIIEALQYLSALSIKDKDKKRAKRTYNKFKNQHGNTLSDEYIIRNLRMNHGIKREQVTPEMIELNRSKILDNRLRRKRNRSKK